MGNGGLPPPSAALVIGYGNDLRGDDGAGVRAAAMIAERSPRTRVILRHQLTPELAADIAEAARVVFVDAYAAQERGAELRVERIAGEAAARAPALGHRGAPAALVDLAGRLFGAAPEAWVVGIPAFSFDAGETLSPETLQRVDEAVTLISGRAFSRKQKGDPK